MNTNFLYDFITNDIVIIALISVSISQFLKTILMIGIEHTFDIKRVFSDEEYTFNVLFVYFQTKKSKLFYVIFSNKIYLYYIIYDSLF